MALRAAELTRPSAGARIALQALAERMQPEALPDEIRRVVERRLQHVPAPEPLGFKAVERLLKDAWGAPVARVIGDVEREPFAVRPASQVHRATLLGGGAVAVKVLRPGLAASLRGELGLVDAVASLAGGALPGIDAARIAREVRERLLDELDLDYEGGVQRSFHRALRRHQELGVPAVHSDLTHESVLVSDWVEGTAAADLTDPAARDRAAALLVRFHVGAAVLGTVHADPDPRDALLDAGGRLWILDFGASRRVAPERVALAAAALDALAAGDARRLARLVAEIGWLAEADAHDGHTIAHRVLEPFLEGPARLDADSARAAGERALAHEEALLDLAGRGSVAPEDLWPLRMLGGLGATLTALGAECDWVALGREALRDGWGTA